MTHQERLMLATLKGSIDGKVIVAKADVRAACKGRDEAKNRYQIGFAHGNLRKAVHQLRQLRDMQRTINEYCKGVGYHV